MNEDDTIQAALQILEGRLRKSGEAIKGPEDARNFLVLKLAERDSEVFAVMFLTTRHRLIEYREMFYGTIDGATVHPREIVRAVIETNASAVVLAHNHPSGVAEPSRADIRITGVLSEILDVIDTRVLDHIIVAGTDTVSLSERGHIV